MASQGVNVSTAEGHPRLLLTLGSQVLRYSALVAGLVYGVYHQSSISSATKRAEIEHEYARKERLIEQAKAEWRKKTMPQETKTQVGGRTLQIASLLSRGLL